MARWVKILCAAVCSFAVLFSCVGYAAVSGNLSISGSAEYSYPLPDIYISKVTCESGGSVVSPTVGSDGTILAPTGTTLGFTTTLSTGEVVYTITVKNNTDEAVYGYLMTKAMSDADNASLGLNNGDIIYSLWRDPSCANVMYRKETTVAPKGELTFYMKVSAKNPNATATAYNALLNFMFVTPVDSIPDRTEDDGSVVANNTMKAFGEILNNPVKYNQLVTQMTGNYDQYNTLEDVNGRASDDYIAYVPDIIGKTHTVLLRTGPGIFNYQRVTMDYTDDDICLDLFGGEQLELNINGKDEKVYFLIKRKNVDGVTGEEYTLYMTINPLIDEDDGKDVIVYAGTFTSRVDASGNTVWYQLGDMFTGEADVNDYGGYTGGGSFDTDKWVSGDENTYKQSTTQTNQSLIYYGKAEGSTINELLQAPVTDGSELDSLLETISLILGENSYLYSPDSLVNLRAAYDVVMAKKAEGAANPINTQAEVVTAIRELKAAKAEIKDAT